MKAGFNLTKLRLLALGILMVLVSSTIHAQEENNWKAYNGNPYALKGLWTGTLYQEVNKEFYFEFRIEEITKDLKVRGTTYIETIGLEKSQANAGYQGTIRFKGTLEERSEGWFLNYKETFIEKQEIDTIGLIWCIKQAANLQFFQSKKSNLVHLKGPWKSFSPTCKPGTLLVTKVVSQKDNKTIVKYMKAFDGDVGVVTEEKLEIGSDSIIIEIWDELVVDGDTVSLFFNGEWILEKFLINKTKKVIKIYDLPEQSTLILHAENLGSQPPNTAAISVFDGYRRQLIRLSSNKNKSEAAMLIRK